MLLTSVCSAKQLTLRPNFFFSVSSSCVTNDSLSGPGHDFAPLDTESDKGDYTDVENEEDWFKTTPDVPSRAQAPSKASKLMLNKVSGLSLFRSSI